MMHRIVSTNRLTGEPVGESDFLLMDSLDRSVEDLKRADADVPESQHTLKEEPGEIVPSALVSILCNSILAVLLGSVAIYAYVFFVTDASPPPTIPLGEYRGMQSKQ